MSLKTKLLQSIKSRSALGLALLYAIFGALWLSVNDALLYNATGHPIVNTLIDVLFIAVTSILFYLLLKKRNIPLLPVDQNVVLPEFKTNTHYLIISFICLLLIVPVLNFTISYVQTHKIEKNTYKSLRHTTKIKVVQYERWRDSRVSDAQVIAADKSFAQQVQKFQIDDTKPESAAEAGGVIADRFDAIMSAYDFEAMSLVDLDGKVILQRGISSASTQVRHALVQQALASGKVQDSDLYLIGNGRIQQDIIAPISLNPIESSTSAQGVPSIIGFVIIHIGPDRFIMPRVLSWPSASSSAEVLVIKNDGNSENIIHTIKNKRQAAILTRAMPGNTPYNNTEAMLQGPGYRGNTVFTVQEPISNSDWKMTSQIDRDEVMEPLQTLLLWVSGITLFAVGLISLAFMLLWKQQRRSYQLELLNESNERDRLLKRFYDLPFIGMAIMHPISKRWLQVNDKLCAIMGYTQDEMLLMTWEEMTHPDDLKRELADHECCLRGEIQSYSLEKRFLHKSGSTIITDIEVNCIRNADGKVEAFLAAIEDITQRTRAETALRESEQRLALVLKGSNDGWWDLDLVSNTAYHSPRWWHMLGYSVGQDTKDPMLWQKHAHPEDVEPTTTFIREVLSSNRVSYEVELRLQHKRGHYVPILTKGYILRNSQGKPIRISGTNTDLTEPKQAEHALRLQEEFNRVLLENIGDGVVACDADLNLVLFNQTARDWHGMDAAQVPQAQWGKYFGLLDADAIRELEFDEIPLVRAFHGESLQHVAMSIKAKGQTVRFVACSADSFYDKTGKKLGAVAVMRDITANLRYNQALRESEALYRRMFDENPHPMWVFDVKTHAFLSVNDAAIKQYGWSREELLSMTILDMRPPAEVDQLGKSLLEPNDNSQQQSSGEWKHLTKDGDLLDVEITSHPLNFSGREARLVTAYNITDRKRDEIEIRTLNRLLLMLTNINQAIVHRLEPTEVFQEACMVAVRDGGFRMVWIGMVNEATGKLDCVASAGHAGNYLETLQFDINDQTEDAPSPRAIREGQHIICQDIASDESIAPWREQALGNSYRAMIALPLTTNGKVVGNFSLYSAEQGIFNEREMTLLDELAGDISYALDVAEDEKHKRLTERALQESEALFQTLASTSPVGILRTDLNGNTLYVNESGCKMAGLQPGLIKSTDWSEATHPEDRQRVQKVWKNAVRDQRGFIIEYRFQRPDGSITWVKGQAAVEKDNDGNFLGFVGTVTDITALKASEESMRMSAAVFENTREGIMVTDVNNYIIMVNRAFSDISQYSDLDVIGKKPEMLASGRHDHSFYSEMWQSLEEIGHWQGEIWNRRKNGDIHPVLMSISVIKDKAGGVANYVGVFADISNLKASEAQLEFLAHHDPLTRLPNRLMLISRMGHAIEVARRDSTSLALLMLDLDRFKNVNDSFGHLAGDELLQQVAQRLSDRLRGVDTVTRLGGDEFTVLLEGVTQTDDAARVAQDIIKTLEVPYKLSNNIEIRISASIGISLFPAHAASALELLQHADAALYQAKSAGRGCARYFSESLTQTARDRFSLEARLREAVPRNELRVYYQPQIDIVSGRIIGAEALVRWQDPLEGLILPIRFIGIAEETGLIGAIGEWVMKEACAQGKRWLDAGLPPFTLAINLSAHQLHHSDIVTILSEVLVQTGFPAHLLELELTESLLMQREAEIIETLNTLRARGIRLAIDDFGTGYSSLAYLKSFPLDILKIDRSFVQDIETDEDDRAITATIIGIAHTLGMKVVAEGVETTQQLEFLNSHHCDIYQGFLVSPPIPAQEFLKLIKLHNAGK